MSLNLEVKRNLAELYLTFVNDYLTLEKFAADYGFEENEASQLMVIGRRLHEIQVEHFKLTGKMLYSDSLTY